MGREWSEVQTALKMVRVDSGAPQPFALSRSKILASSLMLGWDGIAAEEGQGSGFRTFEGIAFSGHCVVMNLSSRPLSFEQRTPRGFRRVVIPPSAMRIHPAGSPVNDRLRQQSHWL